MNTIEKLKLARAKIAKGWAQGYYAYDARGRRTQPRDKKAVCWCAVGALLVASPCMFDAQAELEHDIGTGVGFYNDHRGRTQADMLALFDRTIARLESETP